MLDSGASHNLMPKLIMDHLGLQITRPYKDLFSFDSRKVKCLGLIKELVVTLAQMPTKSVMMDIMVADIPTRFGMLLSRSWATRLGGTLQMDMTYASISLFGELKRLYREVQMAYMISSRMQPDNHPIYVVDTKVRSQIFFNDFYIDGEVSEQVEVDVQQTQVQTFSNEVWNLYLGGSTCEIGSGAGIWIVPPDCTSQLHSYKLYFDYTNNMAEYEALIIGLNLLREQKVNKIHIFGDVELIVDQVKGTYQTRHPRMRAYQNEVCDLFSNLFSEHEISLVPREENIIADSLATIASAFIIPIYANEKYEIVVRHRPYIPDNTRHW